MPATRNRPRARDTLIGQRTMNPHTLLRLAEAFMDGRGTLRMDYEVHVLQIGASAGTWPTTVYKATGLGYLKRTEERAWFAPTEKLQFEIERIHLRQRNSQ